MHAASRGDLRPDPRYDAVGCVVVCIMEDGASAAEDAASAEPSGELQEHVLVLIVDEPLSQDKQYRRGVMRQTAYLSMRLQDPFVMKGPKGVLAVESEAAAAERLGVLVSR